MRRRDGHRHLTPTAEDDHADLRAPTDEVPATAGPRATGAPGLGRWRGRAPWIVVIAFSLSGVVHLAHPATFTRIVPRFLPAKTAMVYVSGVAELACAAGLCRRDRWAGIAAAGLLVLIWPANLQMAITAQESHVGAAKIQAWSRLPLQLPLIWCALQSRPRNADWRSPSRR